MKKAMIMDIQRYSIHDGPGIRTTVFFKGCHMDCKWCHNPESQRQSSEMLFYEERCIGCGACLSLCHQKAHRIEKGRHRVELALCRECSRMEICAENCPAQAMQMCGREMEAEELLEKVLADRDFYGEEGGVTCSGGEALLQGAFLLEFLSLCKAEGISTCLDTTLNVPWEEVERLLPFTDLFLVDIKFMDPKKHMQYCGTEGILTVENLYRLAKRGKRVILRMPILSGINDTKSEVRERRKLLADLPNVERVDCFAVTGHGAGKYRALQREFIPFHENVDLEKLARDMQKRMAGERPGERKSMVRLKFEKGIGEEAVCKSTDNRIHFVMNREPFQHRKCLFYEEALLFDGYSVWFEDTGSGLCFEKDFSLSFFLAPFGYSSKGDGLFSCFDTERREGLCVVLEKQGRVRVEFGNGGILFAFTSLNVHVQKNRWNMVTVVFWQEAGWCGR